MEVSSKVRQNLHKKADMGIRTDAETPGANPVRTQVTELPNFTETRLTFSDGSVVYLALERPSSTSKETPNTLSLVQAIEREKAASSQFSTLATLPPVGNCSGFSGGSGYAVSRDCLVQGSSGAVALSFRATYTRVNGGNDQVNSYSTPRASVSGGTSTTPTFSGYKKNEDYRGPARVSISTVFDRFLGGTSTHKLTLNVGSDKAWASWG